MKPTFPINITILYLFFAIFNTTHTLAQTPFDFDFTIKSTDIPTLPGNCGVSGGGLFMGAGLCGIGNGDEAEDPDSTPFYQGQVIITDPNTFEVKTYWHIIIGDPNSGFAMESYTEVDFFGTGSFGSFSGGQPTDNGGLGSPTQFSNVFNGQNQDLEVISGNGWNPLSNDVDFTGNGSGDPTRTVFRQIMGDGTWDAQTSTWRCNSGEFCSEVTKDRLNFKPIISQSINSTGGGVLMAMQFKLDMSDISYSDDKTAGAITNTLTLTALNPTDGFDISAANFNMEDIQPGRSTVTGGRYVYNDCSYSSNILSGGGCWRAFDVAGGPIDYEEGSYTYSDGSTTDPMSYNWEAFFDPSQNIPLGSGSGNQRKCTSGVSGINTC